MIKKTKKTTLLACLMAAGNCLFTSAAVIANYGDFTGSHVTYVNVRESANTPDDSTPLFGAPTISGNTLDFDPVGFSAAATGGGVDITDGNLSFDIFSHAGRGIDAVQFSEAGDFRLIGLGTDLTQVDVSATFFVEIYEVDGVLIDPKKKAVEMSFSPNADGTFSLLSDGGGSANVQGNWSGSVNVDLNALLDSSGIDYEYGATKVSINLDNTLVAISEQGTYAYIAKKDFSALSVTVIPEPATFSMLAIGSALLVSARRKRFLKNNY